MLDKATLGHPGKYTWCIAEAEDVSPWEPLHVERGLAPHQSAVTVFAGLSPIQVTNHHSHHPEPILSSLRDALLSLGPGQGEIAIVLSPEVVGHMKRAGWPKARVREFLFELAARRNSEWVEAGGVPAGASTGDSEARRTVAKSPDSITLIVAGSTAGAYFDVIPLWGGGSNSRSVTREVRIPA